MIINGIYFNYKYDTVDRLEAVIRGETADLEDADEEKLTNSFTDFFLFGAFRWSCGCFSFVEIIDESIMCFDTQFINIYFC
jgi:hypothetical protein